MFLTIVTFIIILGLLILVHELGHFITAHRFKVKAEEFGLGLPPRMFGYVKDDQDKWKYVGPKKDAADYKRTVWSFNWLPLGGFVAIKGENGDKKEDPDSFGSKKIWQRILIMFSGVAMNFVLAFVLFTIGFMVGVPSAVDDSQPGDIHIMSLGQDSPAMQADMKVGDIILTIDHQPVASIQEVKDKIKIKKDQPMEFVVLRDNQELSKQVIPVANSPDAPVQAGFGLVKTAIVKYPWYQSIYKGAEATITLTLAILKAFAKVIGELVTGQKVSVEVSGPVGIAALTGQVVKLGFIYVLQFTALLSINLAIINLIPIPALDGGRLLFLFIEKLKGSPIKQAVEARIHQIGFILLMILMAFIIFRDIRIYLF